MKNIPWALAAALLVLATGCSPANDTAPPTLSTSWFGTTQDGYLHFMTNDPKNAYMTTWNCWSSSSDGLNLSALVERRSGRTGYGYGVIFGGQGEISQLSDGYSVLISANGGYRVDKIVGGEPTVLQGWTATSALFQGNGVPNQITIAPVVAEGVAQGFTISFNQVAVATVADTTFTDGYYGFIACTGTVAEEGFPDTTTDMRFRLTYPHLIPQTDDAAASSSRTMAVGRRAGAN